MGIKKPYVDFILDSCGGAVKGKTMLELGNQLVRPEFSKEFRTGKEFWTAQGAQHTSIDINGIDGAWPIDMEKNVDEIMQSIKNLKFQIAVDNGTSNQMNNIWQCYKNLYNLVLPDGIVIHILPETGSKWSGKHYLTFEKLTEVAVSFGCAVINQKTIVDPFYGNLVAIASLKIAHE